MVARQTPSSSTNVALATFAALAGRAAAQWGQQVTVYKIQSGQCGEASLSGASTVPYAQSNTPGLMVGTCVDNGFSVPAGTTSIGGCPSSHCVHIDLFAPDGARLCSGDEMTTLSAACSGFDNEADAGICGSACERAARGMMDAGSCFVQGDIRSILDTVTSTCSGYVAADGASQCHNGLYFEAFSTIPGQANFHFTGGPGSGGWSHGGSLRSASAEIDTWEPSVEHAEHTTGFNFENSQAFVRDIDGFEATDQFVMRWRGSYNAPAAGSYTFSTRSDDGSMLYINGAVVVDNDGLHGARTESGTVTLTAGQHSIMILFFENGGGAMLQAMVTPPGAREPAMLGGDMLSNTIGCGDDAGVVVGAGDRCAVDFCEDSSDCPQCAAGLTCQVGAGQQACAGTCYGTCAAIEHPACATCADLGWQTKRGTAVCSESDDINQGDADWRCVNEISQADAEEHCMSAGARLCTATELFELGAGQGTGCGHDSRLIWSSSSSLVSGATTLHCADYEMVAIPGNVDAMGRNHIAPTCINVEEQGAALRCCADTACAAGGGDSVGAGAVPNLVQVAQSNPDFSTLVAAVVAGGLVDTLAGPGPFTVFAPTNEAFAALGDDAVNRLLADHAALIDVLTYHVVSGEVLSSELSSGMRLQTAEGKPLKIRIPRQGPVVVQATGSSATVVQADIQASNGVVHVIDTVLLPNGAH